MPEINPERLMARRVISQNLWAGRTRRRACTCTWRRRFVEVSTPGVGTVVAAARLCRGRVCHWWDLCPAQGGLRAKRCRSPTARLALLQAVEMGLSSLQHRAPPRTFDARLAPVSANAPPMLLACCLQRFPLLQCSDAYVPAHASGAHRACPASEAARRKSRPCCEDSSPASPPALWA